MLMFFFLLLMLAMAWGLADHFQGMVLKTPPPEQTPIKVEAPARPAPVVVPPTNASSESPVDPKPLDETAADEAIRPPSGSADPATDRP